VGISTDDMDRIDVGENGHFDRNHDRDGSYTYKPALKIQVNVPSSAPQPFNPISCLLSLVHLRPDFESRHRILFLKALDFYHKRQYEKASDIVDKYLAQEEFAHSPAAKSSFKVLNHIIHWQKRCTWTGPSSQDWSDSVHIEYTIASIAYCAREWLFYKPEGDERRKKTLDDFLVFALGEIREHIPMPPIAGAVVSDVKVRLP
jgi:hypothetical protein